MLIQRATLLDGTVTSVRVGATIEAVGPDLAPRRGEDVLDAAHGAVLPGLHDHHVHLRAAAAALESVQVGPPQVTDRAALVRVLSGAPVGADGWIRAVGYHESVAGPLDRALLDAISAGVPLRVQHRSGGLWTFNSAGLALLDLAAHPDGRVFRTDPEWAVALPPRPGGLRKLSERLTGYGVSGVTDATPGYGAAEVESFSAARRSGEFLQRIHCMAEPGVSGTAHVTVGACKRILDDAALDLEALQLWIAHCHTAGRAVAVHCVTDAQLVVTIAALDAAGTIGGDRIEHAAVVPDDCVADLRRLDVTVVTQPNFVAERGDRYRADVAACDHHELWRVATLRTGGVAVALSTDFPYGDADPWAAMRAAVHRVTATGHALGINECIAPAAALEMFLGFADQPRRLRSVAVGQPGDLCVLATAPHEALRILDAEMVTATIVAGISCAPTAAL